MRKFACITIGLAISFATTVHPPVALGGEIYKWVDENGVTHFGDRPPQQAPAVVEAITGDLGTSGVGLGQGADSGMEVNEDGQTLAQQRREEISLAHKETASSRQQLQSACDYHQKELARYQPARRVTYTNDQGEVVRLNDDERLELIGKSQDFLDQNCK